MRLGVDVGDVRVGVAACDPSGSFVHPVVTLRRDPERDTDLLELARLADERDAVELVVGLPLLLSGEEGEAARIARAYAVAARRVAALPHGPAGR